jgi:hypothetical protein
MAPRPSPLSLIPNPLRHRLKARPLRERHSRELRLLGIGATVVYRTSVLGVDGAEDVRVRTDRHSPAACVDTLAHGGLSPARPAPSTGARTCKRPSGRAF